MLDKWIVNFPTKHHWKDNSDLKKIEQGLVLLVQMIVRENITSIALPALGCGNGKLNFDRDVLPLMKRYLSPLDIPIEIYTPT